jgi:membrane-associated protease RseP (regulator of RpoE activity)
MGLAQQSPAAPEPAKPDAESRTRTASSYLGVDTRDVTPERVAALKLKDSHGVEVTMVDQDAPAGKAGVKEHEVILSFNGQAVENVEQLRRLIRATPPGTTVSLNISREGQPIAVSVKLASRNQVFSSNRGKRVIRTPAVHIPSMSFVVPQFSVVQFWGRNGMTVEDLTPQLGEFFGVRNGAGVLVRSVQKGSPAEAAGLKAGDVIVKVNNQPISSGADWRHLMRNQRGGTVTLGIIRDRREHSIAMTVPEPANEANHIVLPDFGPDLDKLHEELQHLGPEIQRSVAEAQAEAAREVERAMRDMQREMEHAQRDHQREMERAQRERERALKEREAERQREEPQPPPPPAPPPQ